MASSMIHLAITEAMIKQADFQDFKRLRLGAILPDGAVRGNSHLKKKKDSAENLPHNSLSFSEGLQNERVTQ